MHVRRCSTKYRMNSRDSPTRSANRNGCRSPLRRMQFATATTKRRAQSSDSTEPQTRTRPITLPPTGSIALQQFPWAIARCPSCDSSRFSAMSQVVGNNARPTKRRKCVGVLYVIKTYKHVARGKWLNLRRLIEMERLLQHRRQKHLAR